MKTNKTFYTDSNGRDFIKRVCQYLIPAVSMICSIPVRFSCDSDNWNAVKVLKCYYSYLLHLTINSYCLLLLFCFLLKLFMAIIKD
jgi:hypothetical protein